MSSVEHDQPPALLGDALGDAIAEAVRRALADVGPSRLADRPGAYLDLAADAADSGDVDADLDIDVIDLRDDARAYTDPYAVLGVDRAAAWSEIVAARNRLLRSCHPDAGGNADDLARLNAAYAELRIRRAR